MVLNFSADRERLERGRNRELGSPAALGLTPSEIDPREHFDRPGGLAALVSRLDALRVVGGNAFVLNCTLRRSGLDAILRSMPRDEFVYAGYSAGACVLAPTLEGIHLVDDPKVRVAGYPERLPIRSLGLLPLGIAPRRRSDHPDSAQTECAIGYFVRHGMPFVALRDGETWITEL